ncbi:SH3 domain-containing protein [Spirochaetota bacterium]
MKKMHLYLFIILAAAFYFSCSKPEKAIQKQSGKKIGIILVHNSAVRISPFIFSTRISRVKKGETVEVVERSKKKSWIGKTRDYWFKIMQKNGITGWAFGKNIRVLKKVKEEEIIEYVSDFWEEEAGKIRKDIAGKWWSVNKFGDFTQHGIEIFEDGKYNSYRKGWTKGSIKGEFNFNFNKNEIIFLKSTTFGRSVKFIRRGKAYILRKDLKRGELKFKKIASEKTLLREQKEKENENKSK